MIPNIIIRSLEKDLNLFMKTKEEIKKSLEESFLNRKNECKLVLDDESFSMSTGKVLINLLFLQTFCRCGIRIMKEDLFFDDCITGNTIKNFSNHFLSRYSKERNNFDAFRNAITQTLDEICDLSGSYNVYKGTTFSFMDFIILAATSKEALELFRPEIPENLQFNEIEALFKQTGKKLMKYFKDHDELNLHPLAVSGTGLNEKQFTQMACFVGLKPNMISGIIPILIKDNFVYGLSTLENYYINCIGTRKALCTNYTYVRKSGLKKWTTINHLN